MEQETQAFEAFTTGKGAIHHELYGKIFHLFSNHSMEAVFPWLYSHLTDEGDKAHFIQGIRFGKTQEKVNGVALSDILQRFHTNLRKTLELGLVLGTHQN